MDTDAPMAQAALGTSQGLVHGKSVCVCMYLHIQGTRDVETNEF